MKRLKTDSTGAASMLTVIFVAIILTIITIGFIRLAINEQRISTDDDLTTRAYYAAESGVEDAKRALRAYSAGRLTDAELNADTCDPPSPASDPTAYDPTLSVPSNYDIEYTCQLLELRPASLEYEFEGANETIQVPIYPVDLSGNPTQFQQIRIKWHLNTDQPDGDGTVVNSGGSVTSKLFPLASYPDVSTWNSNDWPAMFRVSVLRHPTPGSFSRNDVQQFTTFVEPRDSNSNPAAFQGGGGVAVDNLAFPIDTADCDPNVAADDYFCEVVIGNFSPAGNQYYLRLTSLYRGAHVEVTIENAGGQPRLFDRAQAVADVTGRAGQVYRRVQTTIDLVSPNIFPDAAITSLTDICKDFFLTDEYADFGGVAGTSCTLP